MFGFFGGKSCSNAFTKAVSRCSPRFYTTYRFVHGLQPLRIGHFYVENDEQVALLIWVLVRGHAFSAELYRISRLNDFSRGTGDIDAPTIEVFNQYTGET